MIEAVEKEPLKITQVHASLDRHGTWEVTVRTQRSRLTLHRRVDLFLAIRTASEQLLGGANDDDDNEGPVKA